MTIKSAQAFYSRITTDKALRTQVQQAATQEERTAIVQASGYEFTQEEWETVTAQNQVSTADGGLSDEELTAVSGGTSVPAYGLPNPSEEDIEPGPIDPNQPNIDDILFPPGVPF